MIRRLRKPAPYQSSFCLLLRGSAHPFTLLIIWSILLFVSFGVTPGLPVLLHGLFVIVLIFPSTDQLYYYKVLTLCPSVVAAQLGDFIHI
jgi:hypothetical protein